MLYCAGALHDSLNKLHWLLHLKESLIGHTLQITIIEETDACRQAEFAVRHVEGIAFHSAACAASRQQ